eukprot:605674-Pelagomonas_calceolata.AAC.1
MYICDVCRRTYHWTCMRELGCYTNEQKQDNNDYWACLPVLISMKMKNLIEKLTLTAKNSCALHGSQAGSQNTPKNFPPAHRRI